MHKISLGFYTPENRTKASFSFTGSPKSLVRRKNDSSTLDSPLRTYYYDNEGKINANPLPFRIAFSASSENPLRYRSSDSKIMNESRKVSRPASKLLIRRENLLTPKAEIKYLQQSIWVREIFVMKNGATVNEGEKIPGFTYKIAGEDVTNRLKRKALLAKFFDRCNQEIKTANKIRFLFTANGKLLKSLAEIPYDSNVVIVSDSPYFIGIIKNSPERIVNEPSKLQRITNLSNNEDSPIYKSSLKLRNISEIEHFDTEPSEVNIIDNIESKFTRKNHSSFSPRRKTVFLTEPPKGFGESRRKSLEKPIRIVNVKERIRPREDRQHLLNRLKLRLGQAALLIDQKLPKLCQQGTKHLMKKYNFGLTQLQKLYAKYKMLVLLSVARDLDHDISAGIERSIFIDCMKNGSDQGAVVLSRVFDLIDTNKNGFVDWEEFLIAMSILSSGNFESQIDLFFKIFDENNNNQLSFHEVKKLCQMQLHFTTTDYIVDYLSETFATLIFEMAHLDKDKSIDLNRLKELLYQQRDNSLIEMFCTFNFFV